MGGSTRHFRPQPSVQEDFLSTNAPKEERPCTRELATVAAAKQARAGRRACAPTATRLPGERGGRRGGGRLARGGERVEGQGRAAGRGPARQRDRVVWLGRTMGRTSSSCPREKRLVYGDQRHGHIFFLRSYAFGATQNNFRLFGTVGLYKLQTQKKNAHRDILCRGWTLTTSCT